MNGMPGARQEVFWLTGMNVASLAYVSKVRIIDQRIHVDCYDPETAQTWWRLPLVVLGGGLGSSLVIPPASFFDETTQQPEEGEGAQVIVLPRHKQEPLALACIQHPLAAFRDVSELEDNERTAENNEDHPLPRTVEEHIWEHAGVRVQLTGDGSVVIDTTQSQKPVRIQLAKDTGILRVSRDGKADERLVLAGPLDDFLQELASYHDGVQDRLAQLEANVKTVAAAIPIEVPPSPGGPDPPETPDLACATIHVSEDVEG